MKTSLRRLAIAAGAIVAIVAIEPGLAAEAAADSSQQRYVEVRGAKLYVQTYGSGPPIVFLHGGLDSFDIAFALQRDVFAADHTVIGIDARGHGHSPDVAGPNSYRQMAEDAAAVIEALGLGAVDVVGHSDGGDTGFVLARDHPSLVRRLVVSGANIRIGVKADEAERRRAETSEQVAARMGRLEAVLPPEFRAAYVKTNPDGAGHWPAFMEKQYRLWIDPTGIELADLARIAQPVLVISGDHDFTPLQETVEIFQALPKGQLLVLPATEHGTFRSQPDAVNAAIRAFLR